MNARPSSSHRYRRKPEQANRVIWTCPECSADLVDGAEVCSACGTAVELAAPTASTESEEEWGEFTLAERRAGLQEWINHYVDDGYRVVSQTSTTAQLIRPRQFSVVWFLIWFLTIGGWLLYLIYHFAIKKEPQVYLSIDEYGEVTERK